MGNTLNRTSPYALDADDREGRLAIESTPEEWFNLATKDNPGGADATVPYPDEIAHTQQGDYVILTRDPETNAVVPISASRDLRKKIEKWEEQNIFKNAEAFTFNKSLNILYFDTDRNTVKISPERVFSANYKYWAVRGISLENGTPVYYTGVSSSDGSGEIISNLVDTTISYDTDGNPVGVTCSGHLVAPLIHSHNYMVQFFDADRILIDQMSFQGYSVRNMTFDITPENAVTDVILNSTSDDIDLVRGGKWSDLSLRIYLKYANGDLRDITSEWTSVGSSTGRVVITGLDSINSDTITEDDEAGFPVVVNYFLTSAAVDNPLIDPDTLTISHTYHVRIVPNSSDQIYKVLPSLWAINRFTKNVHLCMKIYALNEDENGNAYFVDNTYRLRNHAAVSPIDCPAAPQGYQFNVENITDPDSIYYKLSLVGGAGILTNSPDSAVTTSHAFPIPYGNTGSINYSFKANTANGNPFIKSSKAIKNSTNPGEALVNIPCTFTIGSDNKLIMNKPEANSFDTIAQYITKLKTAHSKTANGVTYIPEYIIIRNGKNPTVWNLNTPVKITESLFTEGFTIEQYATDSNYYVESGTPLIVEFVYRIQDENTGNMISRITSMDLYFAVS